MELAVCSILGYRGIIMKLIAFGEKISGLTIDGKPAPYPVLNERDARAAAGVMLVAGIFAFVQALVLGNRTYLYAMVIIFFIEFGIRIFINPKLAPFYVLGQLIVANQRPDYVGAAQKRFAWSLGFGLATVMMVVLFVFGLTGTVPFAICGICLFLLWFETSFGICVGCKMYFGLISMGVIKKPKIMPACPGGVCSIKKF